MSLSHIVHPAPHPSPTGVATTGFPHPPSLCCQELPRVVLSPVVASRLTEPQHRDSARPEMLRSELKSLSQMRHFNTTQQLPTLALHHLLLLHLKTHWKCRYNRFLGLFPNGARGAFAEQLVSQEVHENLCCSSHT